MNASSNQIHRSRPRPRQHPRRCQSEVDHSSESRSAAQITQRRRPRVETRGTRETGSGEIITDGIAPDSVWQIFRPASAVTTPTGSVDVLSKYVLPKS
jgi:hypothetical protein